MGNLVINKVATSNFSVKPFTPDKAVNGVATELSRWVGTVPGWVMVDLGFTYWVDQWVLKNMGVINKWGTTYNMYDYVLQGSNDGKTWSTICSVYENTQSITQNNFNPTRFQYFRTYVSKGLQSNKELASIVEFELYEYANPPYLSALSLSDGTLSPAFNKQIFNYTVTVPQAASQITVTPATMAIGSVLKVNGVTVNNASQSQQVTLNSTGATTITVSVSENNGSISETYTIIVNKAEISPLLDNLVVNGAFMMEPDFSANNNYYDAYVSSNIGVVTITPTALTKDALVSVNGQKITSGQTSLPIDLAYGANQILVYVAEASPQNTYTVMVNRES